MKDLERKNRHRCPRIPRRDFERTDQTRPVPRVMADLSLEKAVLQQVARETSKPGSASSAVITLRQNFWVFERVGRREVKRRRGTERYAVTLRPMHLPATS